MKTFVTVTSLFIFSIGSPLLVAGQITTDCQSQAKEYGVQPELVAQYVEDCVVSMGGEAAVPSQAIGSADSSSRVSDAEGVAEGAAEGAVEGAVEELDAEQSGATAVQ